MTQHALVPDREKVLSPMRPGSIEVLDIGVKDTVQLRLLQDKQVIETLSTDTP